METHTTASTNTSPSPIRAFSHGPWLSISGQHSVKARVRLKVGRASLQLQVVLEYKGVPKDGVDCKTNAPQRACSCRTWCWSLPKARPKPRVQFWVNDWIKTKPTAPGGVGIQRGAKVWCWLQNHCSLESLFIQTWCKWLAKNKAKSSRWCRAAKKLSKDSIGCRMKSPLRLHHIYHCCGTWGKAT